VGYVKGEQVKAGGMNLQGAPLAIQGSERPIGELDGLVIDLATRRVSYLVVRNAETQKKHLLPLDATAVDLHEHTLERVGSEDLRQCEPFDPAAFARYDDEALMSLLFDHTAA
jgi:hypothetical protein